MPPDSAFSRRQVKQIVHYDRLREDCVPRRSRSRRLRGLCNVRGYCELAADFSGRALPMARMSQPRKIYHAALSTIRPGIGSPIGNDANTPIMARQPAITKSAIFGARRFIENLSSR